MIAPINIHNVNLMNRPNKKSILILLILGCFLSINLEAQRTLSEKAQISIITFGPYQGELWSAFGHSGIRVYDPVLNLDLIYDYGRFSFNQADFYWNFARGMLLYSIGRSAFQRYVDRYQSEDRTIREQVLNLTHEEVNAFFHFLENNYKPENREYLYNYVYNNCASILKDVTEEVLKAETSFGEAYVVEGKTVRNLMDDYLEYQPWGDLAIDLGLGSQIDQEVPADVYTFLPDYIFLSFEGATIDRDSIEAALVAKTNIIYERKNEWDDPGILTPLNVFILLFFLVGLITNRDFKLQRRSHWLDVVLFSVVAFVGWWFVFLWAGTEHLSKNNWNLIWAFPFHIPLIFFLSNEKLKPFLTRLYRFLAILHALTLVFWALIPQDLHFALVPLVLTLVLRAFYISYDLGRVTFGR